MALRHSGLLLALVGCVFPLAAQSLWLPASDPVGIGRSGTGVAYGRSLEASALNPALLVTLRDRFSTYAGMGMDMYSTQSTLVSKQKSVYSDDRNRALPSFGGAWRCFDAFALGVKVDSPFAHHVTLRPESPFRFVGRSMDLDVKRAELQAALALGESFSLGVGVGVARVGFASSACLRHVFTVNDVNEKALLELESEQDGTLFTPTWSAGFRWAISPRWTIGGAYQHAITGNLDLKARRGDLSPVYFGNNDSVPPVGSQAAGQAILGSVRYLHGSNRVELPSRATLGIRHRFNQYMTWELDLYNMGRVVRLPSAPGISVSGQTVPPPRPIVVERDKAIAIGARCMVEFRLGKLWVVRGGASLDPSNQVEEQISPLLVGSRSASFSAGFGRRMWGGEINVGYQYRQAKDTDSRTVDGVWNLDGYKPTGSVTRVEGMGHLWSVGYKVGF